MGEDYFIYNPDYVGRTLEEIIADLPVIGEGQHYFIGSQTCYFLIFRDKEKLPKIEKTIEKELIAKAESVVFAHKRRLLAYERPKRSKGEKESEYKKKIENYKARVALSEGRIALWQEYIKNFAPIRERKVKEVFSRCSHDGISIIVEGNEHGRYIYWDEWVAKRKPKKKVEPTIPAGLKIATEPIPGVYMGYQKTMLKPRKDTAYYAPFEGTIPKGLAEMYKRWAKKELSFAAAGRLARRDEAYMRLLFFKIQQGEIQI